MSWYKSKHLPTYLDLHILQFVTSVKQFLQVLVQVLKNQGQLLVGVQNIFKMYDVWMLEFFQESDLADGRTRNSFLFTLKSDLLECIDLTCLGVSCLVHYSIGALSYQVQFLILLHS